MKHLLTTFFAVCLSYTAAVAQEKEGEKAPQEKITLTKEERAAAKEERAAAKAKKESNLLEVFKIIQATPEEQAKMREFIIESNEYGKELRADPDFTEEEKIIKIKVYTKIKNTRIKELLGDDRYKLYRDIIKVQNAKESKK